MRSSIIRVAQALFLAAYALPTILAAPSESSDIPSNVKDVCDSAAIASEQYFGDNDEVKMTSFSCANGLTGDAGSGNSTEGDSGSMQVPTNVCGTQCNVNCFGPSWQGGGPDPNDCQKIANTMANYPQNELLITQSVPIAQFQVGSCYTMFVNKVSKDLQYCYKDWANHLHDVAFNCQAPNNAHGGRCDAQSNNYYIEAYRS